MSKPKCEECEKVYETLNTHYDGTIARVLCLECHNKVHPFFNVKGGD